MTLCSWSSESAQDSALILDLSPWFCDVGCARPLQHVHVMLYVGGLRWFFRSTVNIQLYASYAAMFQISMKNLMPSDTE